MAIQGKFIADFSQFNAEVAKAETQLKGFESQAQSAATSADKIGASSSTATAGVETLAAATTSLATNQNLATLSTEQLDAMIAGEVVALGAATTATTTAAAASGAYGSVLFTTAEAEVAATAATAGLATSLGAAATAVTGFVASIAPWLIAVTALAEGIAYLINKQREAVKAEAEAKNQGELYARASEIAGHAVTTLAEAEKILETAQRHRLLLDPATAAQNYLDKLVEQGQQAIQTASEEAALTEGLAARGIVLGADIDIQKQWNKAQTDAEEAARKHAAELKRLEEANEKFRESVKNLTTDAIGAAKGFGVYGALMADLSSSTAQFADQNINLASALDVTKQNLEALQRAGQFASVAMADLNRQLLKLPNVHSSLDGVDTEIKKTGGSLRELSQAFANLGAISDGALSAITRGFGSVITSIDLAKTSVSQMGSTFLSFASNAGGFFSAWLQIAQVIHQLVGPMDTLVTHFRDFVQELNHAGSSLAEFIQKAQAANIDLQALFDAKNAKEFERALAEIRKRFDEVAAAEQHAKNLLDEASRLYGPSQDDLNKAVDHAKDILYAMEKAGTYTADQLSKAYYAWQKAMADAGNAAAKAWIEAHDAAVAGSTAANAEMQKLIDRRDELTRSISQEAPEAELGVIEQAMRAERDRINQQIADAQAAADAAAEAQKDASDITRERWTHTGDVLEDEMTAAAVAAADHIQDAFDFTIRIPIVFDVQNVPDLRNLGEAPEPIPQASGGDWLVNKPTLFLAGEAGPERATFTPVGRGGFGTPDVSGDVIFEVDGETFARIARRSVLNGGKGMREFRQMLVAAGVR